MFEIEDIMKRKERLKSTITRIRDFRNAAGEGENQDRYILVETLTRICEKANEKFGKQVSFTAKEIDDTVLEYGPRRIIKELLVQLVRNAVFHGIETPDERQVLGKTSEGKITLSMKYKDSMININLSDDGKGLDFEKIREKALSLKLPLDKAHLTKAIFMPGFSTLSEINVDAYAGRGIGLSLVHDRMKDLHGSIKVHSKNGEGTSFELLIPMEMPDSARVS
jgi:two-component system chemotaxis sensor kinase CheA